MTPEEAIDEIARMTPAQKQVMEAFGVACAARQMDRARCSEGAAPLKNYFLAHLKGVWPFVDPLLNEIHENAIPAETQD